MNIFKRIRQAFVETVDDLWLSLLELTGVTYKNAIERVYFDGGSAMPYRAELRGMQEWGATPTEAISSVIESFDRVHGNGYEVVGMIRAMNFDLDFYDRMNGGSDG